MNFIFQNNETTKVGEEATDSMIISIEEIGFVVCTFPESKSQFQLIPQVCSIKH